VARGPIRGFDAGAFGAATESYASCEMLEGGAPDARDDLYALGCVVYEMLSGRHPFGRRSATEARALGLQPAPLPALSRRQNAALARALRFGREARTASVEAFESQLSPVGGWLRPALLAGGVAAVLAVVAVALLGRGTPGPAPPLTPARAPPPLTPAGAASPVTPARAAPPALASTLAAAQSLSEKAAALGVDPDDPLLKVGLSALAEARARMAAGAAVDAAPYLDKAQASLREAIRLSPRIATVGSTPAEIAQALQLCREQTGDSADCSAASFADEQVRRVSLRPFTLDAMPATNAEFGEFVRQTGYLTAAEKSNALFAAAEKPTTLPGSSWKTLRDQGLPRDADPGDFPVRGIDYAAAKAYCTWRGKRLPSEDEWEFAARGPGRRIFPWGNAAAEAPAGEAQLLPVAREPASGAFGGRGLGGSVWEWADGAADAKPILRGPSYLVNVPFYERLATRERENPLHARVDTGVRCAISTDAWPDATAPAAEAR